MRVRRWSFWVWVVKQIGHHKPRYPFGLDLSYTSFAYSSMSLLQPPPQRFGQVDSFDLCISFNVSNTGARDGADVPQLYVTYPAVAEQPPRQLRFFTKVKPRLALDTPTGACVLLVTSNLL
jgi:hypothetical protein